MNEKYAKELGKYFKEVKNKEFTESLIKWEVQRIMNENKLFKEKIDILEKQIEKMKCCYNCCYDNTIYCDECKNNSKWEFNKE